MIKRLIVLIATSAALFAADVQAAEPIKIGWLGSLTGPLSAAAIVINQGIEFSIAETNRAGGIDGRRIELVTRDTAGDPTKAVNLAQQLIHRERAI